jgi:transposase
MRQYSDDLRSKLIHTWQSWDGSQQELADWWGVSRSWLQKVIRRWRETGQVQAARYRHGPVSRMNPQRLTALVEAHPGATLTRTRTAASGERSYGLPLAAAARLSA